MVCGEADRVIGERIALARGETCDEGIAGCREDCAARVFDGIDMDVERTAVFVERVCAVQGFVHTSAVGFEARVKDGMNFLEMRAKALGKLGRVAGVWEIEERARFGAWRCGDNLDVCEGAESLEGCVLAAEIGHRGVFAGHAMYIEPVADREVTEVGLADIDDIANDLQVFKARRVAGGLDFEFDRGADDEFREFEIVLMQLFRERAEFAPAHVIEGDEAYGAVLCEERALEDIGRRIGNDGGECFWGAE